MISQELLERFADIVGPAGSLRNADEQARYLREWRDKWVGQTPLVLRPANTEQVSRIMALANDTHTPVVPQSGNTGLVGGQIPSADGSQLLLSLDRMSRIVEVDSENNTITVEAGCILKSVQDAAAEADRLFPLSLASEGSCRIGGNLSSNAGGLNVLAYGNSRDLCLGLEVVLPDGRVWNGLRGLRKDNTGYDLKNLFIGAEGTLGVITGAVLKLFPRPSKYDTAFLAVPSPEAAVALLNNFKQKFSFGLVAYEIIAEIGLSFVTRHMGAKLPLSDWSPWFVLVECADAGEGAMLTALENATAVGLISDGVVAQTKAQRLAFWEVREKLSDSQKFEGGSIKHDVSLPISRIAQFIPEAIAAVEAVLPGCRFVCFGHLGDGNLHFNISQPLSMDKAAYLARWSEVSDVVHAVVLAYGGSISAEHGIGVLKRHEMAAIKSPVELALMQQVKALFDPHGIMNPGKVLPDRL